MKKLMIMAIMMLSIGVMSFGQGGYSIGDKVEDFNLKGVDGKMHSLSSYNDNGTIVIFTSNHCPYAVLYEDRIIALEKKYGAKGLHVLAINPNDSSIEAEDSFENMVSRSKDKGFNFPYLVDEGQQVYPKFGATRTPHVFLVNKDQVLVYQGGIDDNARDASGVSEKYLEIAIDEMLAGKALSSTSSRPTGCSIKTN